MLMRVLHYEPAIRLELGGVNAVLDIAAEQAKAGANVTLVTHDAKDVPSDFLNGQSHSKPRDFGRLGSGPLQPDHFVNKAMSSIFMEVVSGQSAVGRNRRPIGMCLFCQPPRHA